MSIWTTDNELFALAEQELFTCAVGDVMDKMHLVHQFLPPQIRPLDSESILIGRAMTVLSGDVFQETSEGGDNQFMNKPFGLMLEALDDLRPNEVYVNTGSSPRNALWGEMMTTRATVLGARGAVVNGYYRDTRALQRMKFPTFGFGSYGQDSAPRYKVYDFRVPIEIGCVRICSGDLIFGDIDGICVVPSETEEEVFRKALEKVRRERLVKQHLAEGNSAVSVFKQYGIM